MTQNFRGTAWAAGHREGPRRRRWRKTRAAGLALVLIAATVATAPPVRADAPRVADEPLTRFERFVTENCSPCVKESSPTATLQILPVKMTTWPRAAAGRTMRQGEIGIEAIRAYPLGLPGRQVLGLRITLSVATGNPGETYRIAGGVVDEEETAALLSGIADIVQATSRPTPSGSAGGSVELDVQSTAVRVGVARFGTESIAYVQAGDVRTFGRRSLWETPGTLYLAVTELGTLRTALAQAAAKVQAMRGAR